MKAYSGKYHVLLTSNIQHIVQITSSLREKLVRIIFVSELKFEEHITKMCHIFIKKLNALHRIGNDTNLDKRKTLSKAFTESKFSYCSII